MLRLREKGNTIRWQPISPTLLRHLQVHHEQRSDRSHPRLLCYRDGAPLTARRYDHLWSRVGVQVPWVVAHGVSTHWLRHTTLTWVERHFGYAVTRAYAGHTRGDRAGVTSTYIRADLDEVARALSALTGEPHPLANPDAVSAQVRPLLTPA